MDNAQTDDNLRAELIATGGQLSSDATIRGKLTNLSRELFDPLSQGHVTAHLASGPEVLERRLTLAKFTLGSRTRMSVAAVSSLELGSCAIYSSRMSVFRLRRAS